MPQTPISTAPFRTHTGARRLNGIVWGLLLLAGLWVAATWGRDAGIIALLVVLPLLFPLVSVGIGANLVLFCWKVATGRFRQALGYGLGFVLLAVLFLGLHLFLGNHRLEKWW